MDMITLSRRETKRLNIIHQALDKRITQKTAAELVGLSSRQLRRMLKRVREEGDDGISHRSRGKASNRRFSPKIKGKVLKLYRGQYSGFGPTFASEKLFEVHEIKLSDETLRLWLNQENIPYEKRKGRKHRQWRERKHHFGEMVQMDGSHHAWFEDRGPECVLMGYIDDATGAVYGHFYDYEGTMPAMDSFKRYIKRYGIPQSVYLDKHTTYKSPAKQSIEDELEDKKPLSQFERSLAELTVTVIHANSPQAKGRIERQFRTLQDRLVKEMRLAGIKSVDQANEFLIIYLPKHNTKFKVKAVSEVDLHRPALSMRELNKIFCIREERTLQNDFTIAYNGKLYQIKDAVKTRKVTVEERMDGSMHITHKGLDLSYREITTRPAKENPKKPAVMQEKQGRYQSPNHPWKRLRRASEQLPAAS
ncbi:MAG TPA: ISNCY family transposase [Nitrospirota bacterium]|nr:ISNCY family transposase [Nitrospirota bacterium]